MAVILKTRPVEEFNAEVKLLDACCRGDLDAVKDLINCGVNINCMPIPGGVPLIQAVSCNRIEIVEYLLTYNNLYINKLTGNGHRSIHAASLLDNSSVLRALLKRQDINVNVRRNNFITPLCLAVDKNKTENIKILIAHGAEVLQTVCCLYEKYINATEESVQILENWKQYLPQWTTRSHRYYPKEFKEFVITWLMCVKHLKHKAFDKDIRTLMCKYLAVGFKEIK